MGLGFDRLKRALIAGAAALDSHAQAQQISGGNTAGIDYFFVIAGGGTGALMTSGGTPYDSGFWATCRFNGNTGALRLPAGIVAYRMDGLPLVASGGDGVTAITDVLNSVAQSPTQPPSDVLATATLIE